MPKFNTPIRHLAYRFLRILDVAGLSQHFRDTPDARHTHGDHHKDHGQHHETHQNVHTISKQTHQFPCRKCRSHYHLRSDPTDQKDTAIDCELHKRRVIYQIALRFHEDTVDILARLLELHRLLLFPDIGFYHADSRDILLNRRVHIVILRERLLEILCRMSHDQHQQDPENQYRSQIDARQP